MTTKKVPLRALLAAAVAAGVLGMGAVASHAADKTVTIGITLPLTGADAQSAE
ncbi:MAG: hypothetical protein JO010_05565, partial [Alphaproteobacteria bacterium]|nr:hypothetical protein [Alphaproteobacteria bacterium]